jgi:glycosyltransferase involved in cell wall biosynthesis
MSSRLRIAFIAQPFDRMHPPVETGSLALWIYYMAGLCARRGHSAVVFGNHGGALTARSVSEAGVQYVFTPTLPDRLVNKANRVRRRLTLGDADPCVRPLFASSWHHAGFAAEAAWRARRWRCDVVHIMTYSQFVPVVRRIHPDARIVLHMHCEWLTQLEREMIRPRLEQTDVIVGCSAHITQTIVAAFPELASRCVTVQDSAHPVPDDASPEPDGRTVLFVGRLSPEKGVHDLIRAFHLVLKRLPDARLHLVGPSGSAPIEFLVGISRDPLVSALRKYYPAGEAGAKDPYLAELEREAGAELGTRIVFEGAVPHAQVSARYLRAALVVNPSLSEASGIGVLEAMMHARPLVVTTVGGMTDAVEHGRTGLLVTPADPERLASAICQVLDNPAMAWDMGCAGKAKAREMFSWDRSADALLGSLQSARC